MNTFHYARRIEDAPWHIQVIRAIRCADGSLIETIALDFVAAFELASELASGLNHPVIA